MKEAFLSLFSFKDLEKWGLFLIHNPAFSLAQEAQRKSLAKRNAVFMGAAQTRKLLKKLDQNFHTLVQCEHCAFVR